MSERPEYHPIPEDENDKRVKEFFPKRDQTQKALEHEEGWTDLTKELDETKETK